MSAMSKFYLLLAMSVFFVFGCRPPEDETQYNIAQFESPMVGNECSLEPSESSQDLGKENCEAQNGCQAVLDNGNNYLGCMPIPQDEEPAPGNDPVGDDDDYTPPKEDGDKKYSPEEKDEDEKNPNDYACEEGGKKVLICHKAGSHDAHKQCGKPKTLCISINGWENGHQKNSHHEGVDHLGPCDEGDMQEDDDAQPEIQGILQQRQMKRYSPRLIHGTALVN